MLGRLGYEVVTRSEGTAAIAAYAESVRERRPFDLVIVDLTVPGGMGGRDMVQHLQEIDPKVKIVVSSGYADDPVMADHTAYGFCATLPKPFALNDLRQAVTPLTN
jgi:DNA-binding NtrC family response regulator